MTIIEALVQLRNDLKLWVTNNLRVKVDKEDGKGLSSNDFTTEEKEKLAGLSTEGLASVVYVDEQLDAKADSDHSHDQYLEASDISGKADKTYVDEQLDTKADLDHSHEDYVAKETGKGLSTNDFTAAYKTKLDGIATGANAYTHPSYTAKSSGLYKVAVDSTGHVSGATAVTKADITALGIPAQDTAVTVDSAMSSSSTNPVQNKVVNSAVSKALSDAKAYTDSLIEGLTAEGDANAGVVQAALNAHTANTDNPHGVTLSQLGVAVDATELNYLDGVTSNVQEQLDAKADSDHSHDDVHYTETEIDEMLSPITSHVDNSDIHVTADDKTAWNAKMDAENPTGTGSFSLNRMLNTTVGDYSVAIGNNTTASGNYSHAEGYKTVASGKWSHAEGYGTTASNAGSHAEGEDTDATGTNSHAEGIYSKATGYNSHAEGTWTIAAGENQHTQGKYNIEDTNETYAHIVGNGNTDYSRSNAHTLDWEGNAWYAGDVYVGGTSQDDAEKLLKASDVAGKADKSELHEHSNKTVLDGITSEKISAWDNKFDDSNIIPIVNGGTDSSDGATGLANLFAAGQTILSSNQYGDTLPSGASEGTMFFKKATGTVADMDTNLVSELMLKAYPVGSIYMSVNSTSPASLFGGTWTRLENTFLWGTNIDSNLGKTGGSSANTLTESNLPGGAVIFNNSATSSGWSLGKWDNYGTGADWYAIPKSQTSNTGVSAITNMPPYLEVAMWKRTA